MKRKLPQPIARQGAATTSATAILADDITLMCGAIIREAEGNGLELASADIINDQVSGGIVDAYR